jgi:hypothetical protein
MARSCLLICLVFIETTTFADPPPPPAPAPRPLAVLKEAIQGTLDALPAVCLLVKGPIPAEESYSRAVWRLHSFADANGLSITEPNFAESIEGPQAAESRICVGLKALPATPLKDIEPFVVLKIPAQPGWKAQCAGFEDGVPKCVEDLLKKIDDAGQMPVGTPRIVFAEPQPEPEKTITVVSIPTRAKPPKKSEPAKPDGRTDPPPAHSKASEDAKPAADTKTPAGESEKPAVDAGKSGGKK